MDDEQVSVGPYPDRPIRIGVFSAKADAIVAEQVFEPGADVVVGGNSATGLKVEGWTGPALLLISQGRDLHLAPGMRLVMCDEAGGHRVAGTFEDLSAEGATWPMPIPVSRLNVRLPGGFSVFIHFTAATAQQT